MTDDMDARRALAEFGYDRPDDGRRYNGRRRLDESDYEAIRAAYRAGETVKAIAASYGIDPSRVYQLLRQ